MHRPPAIPATSADLTAEWTQAALAEAGFEARIDAVAVEPIGTGQMAYSFRVTPHYVDAGTAPESLVVKMASSDPNSRSAGARGAYLKEVRFYQQLAHTLPTATPRSYWAAIDVASNDFVLLLEDMRPARQGDQIAGCDIEQVRTAARNIAGLHAPHWCNPALLEIGWLAATADERVAAVGDLKSMLAVLTPGFIDRYDGRLDAEQVGLLQWFADSVDEWLANDGGRFALMHGDHRLDNLLFDPHDRARPVTVVDWQTLAVRNPLADISYLLGTSLEPEVRRDVEHEIVADYHRALVDLGVEHYDLETCFADYCAQTPHSLLLCVLGSMLTIQTDRGDDMFMAMMDRSSVQIAELYPR